MQDFITSWVEAIEDRSQDRKTDHEIARFLGIRLPPEEPNTRSYTNEDHLKISNDILTAS